MSARIVLVRHAMPTLERGLGSKLWGLGESARQDCVLLAESLREADITAIASSGERKAFDTARVLGLRLGIEVRVDPGFGEVDRQTTWDDDYRSLAERYISGEDHPQWEPRNAVSERFGAATERAMKDIPGDLIIVNHGLALTLYVANSLCAAPPRNGTGPFDPVAFWKALTFPDAWRYDAAAKTLERLFNAGLPPPDA